MGLTPEEAISVLSNPSGWVGTLVGNAAAEEVTGKHATIGQLLDAADCPTGPGTIQSKRGNIKVTSVRQFWIAVARAESGGDATNTPNGPYKNKVMGLWQINSEAHHEDVEKLKDPVYNTSVAKRVSSNWTNAKPWDVVTFGTYKSFDKPGNDVSVKNYDGGFSDLPNPVTAVPDAVGAVTGGIDAIAGSIEDLVSAIFDPSTYLRLGKGLLGVIVILLGLWALYSAYGGPSVPIPAAKAIKAIK